MKRRAASVFAASLLLLALPAVADSPAPDDARPLEERARRLHDEAAAIRQAADARHAEAQKDCWRKFLVNACLDEATRTMQDERIRANGLDREARTIERELRRRKLAEREARLNGRP